MTRFDRGPLLLIAAGLLLPVSIAAYLAEEAEARAASPAPRIAVRFSPRGGCTEAIVAAIGSAAESVRVQAYSFTSRPIADALIATRRRGVAVEIVLDAGQRDDPHSLGGHCADAGIPVTYDAKHAIAHNKVMVIDGRIVISGSFNYSAAAEHANAENLLILRDAPIADIFGRNWADHRGHSEP